MLAGLVWGAGDALPQAASPSEQHNSMMTKTRAFRFMDHLPHQQYGFKIALTEISRLMIFANKFTSEGDGRSLNPFILASYPLLWFNIGNPIS